MTGPGTTGLRLEWHNPKKRRDKVFPPEFAPLDYDNIERVTIEQSQSYFVLLWMWFCVSPLSQTGRDARCICVGQAAVTEFAAFTDEFAADFSIAMSYYSII